MLSPETPPRSAAQKKAYQAEIKQLKALQQEIQGRLKFEVARYPC
jgi:hypothetical protein